MKRNKTWLHQALPEYATLCKPQPQPGPSRPRGRPPKPFHEASMKTKKRRVAELAADRTSDELQFAADISAKSSTAITEGHTKKCLTPHQTLALVLDLDLSERKYKLLRSVVNSLHENCFPSQYTLNNTKKSLLPSQIEVTETSAEVNLQELLQMTTESILKTVNSHEGNEYKLLCKWGFDGSSGHSTYKMKFIDEENTDEYLFLTAFVPLKLIEVDSGREVWVNERTSSSLFCRPIKFMFVKENADLVRHEDQKMREKIKGLQNCTITTACGRECSVRFELLFTMIDGSVSNILSGTNATSKCNICGATPKEMNVENVLNRPSNIAHFSFGLSTLHCWIRFFECLLHIAYRLPLKSWQVRGNRNKQILEDNKKRIQVEFKTKMGLLIDKPKPGYGSTNDGNTARRFFSNPETSSEITGINKELIVKFSIILRVLASGCHIELEKFGNLLHETRDLYLSLYKWYYMPSTVHKVLVHGCDIIGSFNLPIGQLSEDALEARHKEVRRNRLSHTRKSSRQNSNQDLMNILLLTSDPFISSLRKISTHKMNRIYDGEVNQYLKHMAPASCPEDLDIPNIDLSDDDTPDSD